MILFILFHQDYIPSSAQKFLQLQRKRRRENGINNPQDHSRDHTGVGNKRAKYEEKKVTR